jgi:hypothetical protein
MHLERTDLQCGAKVHDFSRAPQVTFRGLSMGRREFQVETGICLINAFGEGTTSVPRHTQSWAISL